MFTGPVPLSSCWFAIRQYSCGLHRFCLAGEVIECQALTEDSLRYENESLSIRQLTIIVTEGLLVEIPEEVQRFNTDVSSRGPAF